MFLLDLCLSLISKVRYKVDFRSKKHNTGCGNNIATIGEVNTIAAPSVFSRPEIDLLFYTFLKYQQKILISHYIGNQIFP